MLKAIGEMCDRVAFMTLECTLDVWGTSVVVTNVGASCNTRHPFLILYDGFTSTAIVGNELISPHGGAAPRNSQHSQHNIPVPKRATKRRKPADNNNTNRPFNDSESSQYQLQQQERQEQQQQQEQQQIQQQQQKEQQCTERISGIVDHPHFQQTMFSWPMIDRSAGDEAVNIKCEKNDEARYPHFKSKCKPKGVEAFRTTSRFAGAFTMRAAFYASWLSTSRMCNCLLVFINGAAKQPKKYNKLGSAMVRLLIYTHDDYRYSKHKQLNDGSTRLKCRGAATLAADGLTITPRLQHNHLNDIVASYFSEGLRPRVHCGGVWAPLLQRVCSGPAKGGKGLCCVPAGIY